MMLVSAREHATSSKRDLKRFPMQPIDPSTVLRSEPYPHDLH